MSSNEEIARQRRKAMSNPDELLKTLTALERASRYHIDKAHKQDAKALKEIQRQDESIRESFESWGPNAFTRILKKLWE